MLAGSAIAWNRQDPFLSEDEVRALLSRTRPSPGCEPGTPLAFLVNEPDDTVSFLATRAGNVIRAGVPPDRIRDVVVVVPPLDAGAGSGERGALERLTARDLAAAEDRAGRSAAVIVLTAVRRGGPADGRDPDRPGARHRRRGTPSIRSNPRRPRASRGRRSRRSRCCGWPATAGRGSGSADTITAAAAAPAIGAAVLILVATALDALGVPLGRATGALAASALAGGGGYLDPVRPRAARRIGCGATGRGATSRVARSRPA